MKQETTGRIRRFSAERDGDRFPPANLAKYPVEKSRGSSRKYDQL